MLLVNVKAADPSGGLARSRNAAVPSRISPAATVTFRGPITSRPGDVCTSSVTCAFALDPLGNLWGSGDMHYVVKVSAAEFGAYLVKTLPEIYAAFKRRETLDSDHLNTKGVKHE